jgi:hypothetical protein
VPGPPKNSFAEDLVFAMLQKAAASGCRCPTNPEIAAYLSEHGCQIAATTIPSVMKNLTRQGRVVVRLYGKNWRAVTICTGTNTDKTTMTPPHGGEPYLVITATGRTRAAS